MSMRELTEKHSEVRIYHQGDRLFYVAHGWCALICTRCGGALVFHSFVSQSELRFPFFQQCKCEKK